MYISNYRNQITCSFVKFGCSIGIFLNSANVICRSTDISKCFRGSLRLRDIESRLYLQNEKESLSKLYQNKNPKNKRQAKKTLSGGRYESRSSFGSAIYQSSGYT